MALNKRKAKKELLQELEKNYLLQRACNKLGLTRSTVYRWMQEDEEFAGQLRAAQMIGRRYMSDFVESKLLKNVENQEERAIEFWLKHNNEHYRSAETLLDRRNQDLKKQLTKSRNALSVIGDSSLMKEFVDWDKVRAYLNSPERRQRDFLLQGSIGNQTEPERELLSKLQELLKQIKLAEFIKKAEDIPEEYRDLVDD